MTNRKNPVAWVSRAQLSDMAVIWPKHPAWNAINMIWEDADDGSLIARIASRQLSKLTGLKLKPGECKAIRINVEVVK